MKEQTTQQRRRPFLIKVRCLVACCLEGTKIIYLSISVYVILKSSFSPLRSKRRWLTPKKRDGGETKLTFTLGCRVIALPNCMTNFLSEKNELHISDVSEFLEAPLWQMWSALDIFLSLCMHSLHKKFEWWASSGLSDTSENSQLLVTESKAGHNHNRGFLGSVFNLFVPDRSYIHLVIILQNLLFLIFFLLRKDIHST